MNTELTREQKRIKIAEADGWTGIIDCGHGISRGVNPSGDRRLPIPNYFKSRNACIEVILKMNPIKRQDFIHALTSVVAPALQWHEMHLNELFNFLTATPDQLCEAIGATLDLW